jgi:twinkle protein
VAQLLSDSIDFDAYLEDTDAEHRVIRASSYLDDVIEYFHSDKPQLGAVMPWEKTHNLVRFRPGEVTLWSGMNGHGKSLILGQTCLGFVTQGKKICIASMEMKPLVTLARMCRQSQFSYKPDVAFIHEFHRQTDGLLWLYDQQGMVKTQKMIAVLRYCADKLKVEHFVIDSLMKCGMGEDDYNGQKHFVDAITSVARDTGMHIHLVAHSRKAKDEFAPPGKMDVKGTGAITDQVDNVLTVWRNKKKEADAMEGRADHDEPDALILCDKQRNGEWEGKIKLFFHPGSMQFLPDRMSNPIQLFRA